MLSLGSFVNVGTSHSPAVACPDLGISVLTHLPVSAGSSEHSFHLKLNFCGWQQIPTDTLLELSLFCLFWGAVCQMSNLSFSIFPLLLRVSEVFSQALHSNVEACYLLWPRGLLTIPQHPLSPGLSLVPLPHPSAVFISVQSMMGVPRAGRQLPGS